MRILFVVLIVVALAAFFAIPTIYSLRKIHPQRRKFIALAACLGNLFWLLLPLLIADRLSPVSRWIRSILGPPWFTWVLFSLLYMMFLVVCGVIWMIFRRRTKFSAFARRPSAVFLLLLLLVAIEGFIQCLVPLDVRAVTVPIADLPPSLRGTRIALLSDLHVGQFTRQSRLERFAREIESADADLVLLSGDLIDDDPHFVPDLLRGFSTLRSDIPVYAVLGNHEMYGDPYAVIAGMKHSRIQLLVNEGAPVRRGGSTLWIAGLSDSASGQAGAVGGLAPDLNAAMRARPANAVPILLVHQPSAFPMARERKIPLTLSGHTHGGQCGVRAFGWTLAGVFLPHDMGLYEEGSSRLYVNTGTGYWLVPLRIGLTPEITILTLENGS